MTAVTVKTQGALDKALADGAPEIVIDSPAGVWLNLTGDGSSHVVARDSSHVEAWGSSHVVARGSSRVVARGSSHVVAWDSSHVVAWGSSRVVAWGSSRVEARESSHVVAWDFSRVVAGKYVAVHLHSQRVSLTGEGHVIDMTALDLTDPATWADYCGVKIADGRMTVFKGVNAELVSDHGMAYPIGETVTAPDWKKTAACGNGLHFSPAASATLAYTAAVRFLECTIALDETVVITDKVKAKSCLVVREVDRFGDPVVAAAVSA